MSSKFIFHGQTTFINQPQNTTIQDFQNTYVSGEKSGKDKSAESRQSADSYDNLLAQATCSILIDGSVSGTAWLVSNQGHLMTAGHILGTDTPLSTVEVRFANGLACQARRVQWGFQEAMGIDFAILQLESPIDARQPLPISLARSVSGRFRLLGYGKTLSDRSGGIGEFVGFYDPQNMKANRLFRLRSSELAEEGYSGGAVFSDDLQAVVAVQIAATVRNLGAGRDTVLAMPLYRIAHYWEVLVNLEKKNRRR